MIRLFFPRSLTDQAMEWYFTLPRYLIKSFALLVEKYLERFSAITKREMLIQSTWKHNPGESFSSYPARFKSFTQTGCKRFGKSGRKPSPASMPREPELLFDFPYPYITVSTLKVIAFQVERLFKSVLSRCLTLTSPAHIASFKRK